MERVDVRCGAENFLFLLFFSYIVPKYITKINAATWPNRPLPALEVLIDWLVYLQNMFVQSFHMCSWDWVWRCACICKMKVFFILILWWPIGIWDYWFWYLEIIGKVVLEMIGFAGDEQRLLIERVRSDRVVVAGQTGVYRAVRSASTWSDRPTLCRFWFRVVLLDIRG